MRAETIDELSMLFPEELRGVLTFEEEPDSLFIRPTRELEIEEINKISKVVCGVGGICLFIDERMCFRVPKAGVAEKELKPVSKREEGAPAMEEAEQVQPSVVEKKIEGKFETIPINALSLSPFDARPKKDQELSELAKNIKNLGVLEPIVVRPKPDGLYEIVCGGRRWRAANMAGLAEVPCVVRSLSDGDVLLAQISENVARKDIPDIAKAHQLKQLTNAGYTQIQIAEKLGKSNAWVSQHLRMLELETFFTRVKKVLRGMTEKQARVILSAPDDVRKEVVEWIEEKFEKSREVPPAREIQEKMDSLVIEREPVRPKAMTSPSKPEEVSAPIKCSNCKNLTYSPHFLKDGRVLCDGCFENLVSAGLVAEEEVAEHPKVEFEPMIPERPKSYCPICGHIIGARLADAVDNLRERFPEFFEELKEALEE